MTKTMSGPMLDESVKAACVEMESKLAAAVAVAKRSNNGMIDAALDLARSERDKLKPITDDPDEVDAFQDLTGKFTALRQPV